MFFEKWLDFYLWLRWDDKLCGMTCHACYGPKQSIHKWFVNLRTSTLATHESSKSHLAALKQLQLQSQLKKAVAKVETEHEKC